MKSETIYIIEIEDSIDESWGDWFDGMSIQPAPQGGTNLKGPVRDQAALIGLIDRIYDLGLVLISVVPQE